MKLFNTLNRKLEDLEPLKPPRVSLYTCGPTVYDHVHIGNLRTYIFEDTLRRVMKIAGLKVSHLMNITDVDDKTIARSRQQYPDDEPRAALSKLTRHYEKVFLDDAQRVGIDFNSSKIVRATEHITDMQALITRIPYRYTAEDGVYFEIDKYPDYGVFSKLDRRHTHHRIQNDEYDKDHVADFALWKIKKDTEPSWDFEIEGQNMAGRPGWHIECSAMSTKYLGQPFDIHSGGVDLKFPHHENEIAQSRAVNGDDLARYFVHAEHLLVDGAKMAKSQGNYLILDDLIKKGFDPLAFRLLVLQAHYRSQLNFTWNSIAATQKFLQTLRTMADRQFQPQDQVGKIAEIDGAEERIKQALERDVDTAGALAVLAEVTDRIDQQPLDKTQVTKLKQLLRFADEALGLGLSKRQDINSEINKHVQQRETARQAGDFKSADTLRDQLEQQGIGLKDNPFGVTWYRLKA